MDNLYTIKVPTPFNVGRVNCYLLQTDDVPLIDPGPTTSEAYEAVTGGLHEVNLTIEDVDQLLITHPHMDHYGLASAVAGASGARVVTHEHASKHPRNTLNAIDYSSNRFWQR